MTLPAVSGTAATAELQCALRRSMTKRPLADAGVYRVGASSSAAAALEVLTANERRWLALSRETTARRWQSILEMWVEEATWVASGQEVAKAQVCEGRSG